MATCIWHLDGKRDVRQFVLVIFCFSIGDKYLFLYVGYLTSDMGQDVVATPRWNGTCSLLTSAKLSVGYLVVGIIRELDKEPSLHCSSIYINYMWSVLQQY